MILTGKRVSTSIRQLHRRRSDLHVVFLHIGNCPIVGTIACSRDLIFEDGFDRLPAALAVLIEVLD
jgi:hypothetical protein